MAARSKTWTVFALSNTDIMGSNPTRGMDICIWVYSLIVFFCAYVAASQLADPPSKES
jgi:hypothetical protein